MIQENNLYTNGKWTDGQGPYFTSLDPATGDPIWEGKSSDQRDVDEAVAAARQAFPTWAQMAADERMEYISKFADIVAKREAELTSLISRETGKPRWESCQEVVAMQRKVALTQRAFAERAQVHTVDLKGTQCVTRHRPHGVVAVLGPYNFPGHLPNGHMIPALLLGNTVVFKPSEYTPYVGQWMTSVWDEAGLPPGVLNLVQGGSEPGISLCHHADINGLFFTGSAATGLAIHKYYGGMPEKILALEMGGNNALIVHEVQDIKAAAYWTVMSAFVTSGQRCVCARRLIVVDGDSSQRFLKEVLELTSSLKVDLPTAEPEPFMGPVISKDAVDKILTAQAALGQMGGEMLLEAVSLREITTLLSPGIMDVTGVKDLPDQEIFGPFLQVIRVPDYDAAIAVANDTQFGLAAGVLSDNEQLFRKFYALSQAGIVNWNRPLTGASSQAPFGGIKHSGNHRPSGYYAVDYCSYPVASMEHNSLVLPDQPAPGISL